MRNPWETLKGKRWFWAFLLLVVAEGLTGNLEGSFPGKDDPRNLLESLPPPTVVYPGATSTSIQDFPKVPVQLPTPKPFSVPASLSLTIHGKPHKAIGSLGLKDGHKSVASSSSPLKHSTASGTVPAVGPPPKPPSTASKAAPIAKTPEPSPPKQASAAFFAPSPALATAPSHSSPKSPAPASTATRIPAPKSTNTVLPLTPRPNQAVKTSSTTAQVALPPASSSAKPATTVGKTGESVATTPAGNASKTKNSQPKTGNETVASFPAESATGTAAVTSDTPLASETGPSTSAAVEAALAEGQKLRIDQKWDALRDLLANNPEAAGTTEGMGMSIECQLNAKKPNYIGVRNTATALLKIAPDDPYGNWGMAEAFANGKSIDLRKSLEHLSKARKSKKQPPGLMVRYYTIWVKKNWIFLLIGVAGLVMVADALRKKLKKSSPTAKVIPEAGSQASSATGTPPAETLLQLPVAETVAETGATAAKPSMAEKIKAFLKGILAKIRRTAKPAETTTLPETGENPDVGDTTDGKPVSTAESEGILQETLQETVQDKAPTPDESDQTEKKMAPTTEEPGEPVTEDSPADPKPVDDTSSPEEK